MKISHLSSIWDYINRAMPWNAPKSLTTDEVYGVLAYILNLGDIVPADFTLSNGNIAEVEKRLPNRFGHVFYEPMWLTRGRGDVTNARCMHDCPVEGRIASSIPAAALDSNGNIAEQVRPFGPARGTDTSASETSATAASQAQATAQAVATQATAAPASAAAPATFDAQTLLSTNGCTGCHGLANKIVGPAFREVAKKYAGRADAVDYLAGKIKAGGQGLWGPIPMPAQPQVGDAQAHALAQWLAAGAP